MRLTSLLPVIAALSLSLAVYTPKSRSLHARHAALLKARSPAPAPAPAPVPLKKRDSKKCKARPSTSAAPTSSQVAPLNPGQDPSQTQAPAPPKVTTHQQLPPTQAPPHTTHKPSPTTTAQPHTTTHPSSGGGGGGGGGGSDPFPGFFPGTNTGQLTYYELGLTACGQTYSDSDHVAAISHLLFDQIPGSGANPNANPVCGKKIKINYQGKSVTVAIVDRCTGCALLDVDLSPSAFQEVGDMSSGRLFGATWTWA